MPIPRKRQADEAYTSKLRRVNDDPTLQILRGCLHLDGASVLNLSRIASRLLADSAERPNVEMCRELLGACSRDHDTDLLIKMPVEDIHGNPLEITVASPIKLVGHMINSSPGLQRVYSELVAKRTQGAAGQLNVDFICAFDEFTPGNLRKPHNHRKTWF